MAVNLYDAVNLNGLFNSLGKVFKAQADINTSRGTTIPTDVLSVVDYFEKITQTAGLSTVITPVPGAIAAYQSGAAGAVATLQRYAQSLVVQMVADDATQTDRTLATALRAIITQMKTTSQTLDASAVTVTVTAGGSNASDAVVLHSKRRGDGLTQENALAETLTAAVSGVGRTAGVAVTSTPKASGALGQDWPGGSGVSRSLVPVDAESGGVVSNGGFEAWTTTNVPDGWLVTVGVPGTTIFRTVTEVQTVAISGTPTSGWYALRFTDASGKTSQTSPIAFDATASDVQAALRLLPGLSSVAVTATGTSPNYTHQITFTGRGGDVAQLTSFSALTGGTPAITHATTTAGTAQVFSGGSAMQWTSDGTELTAIQQAVALEPLAAYAVSLWATADAAPAAGAVTVDLVDGVSGAVIADAQAVSNSIAFNANGLTTAWQHLKALQAGECVFRTPATLPTTVYLRIRITTAITSGRKVFFDQLALAPMAEIYPGGPMLAALTGSLPLQTGDTWAVAVTNDRAGLLREWCNRNFQMDTLGLLFPTSSTPTIPDSVVS